MLAVLGDLLLPGGCASCAAWIPPARPRSLVCARCLTRLRSAAWPRCPRCDHPRGTGRERAADCLHCRAWPEALVAARQAVVLEGPAVDLVHGLKYEGWAGLARPMGERMAQVRFGRGAGERPWPRGAQPASRGSEPGSGRRCLVPIPTTAGRIRQRGYNQAELLAEEVGRRWSLPVRTVLRRVRGGRSQTSLRPDQRLENVRGAFRPERTGAVEGMHVVLVDDVLTTGATAAEASRVLASEGASSVSLVAFARALPDGV